ncbi:phosphotyrosine-specific ptp2-like protein [Xanthoria calcicola]
MADSKRSSPSKSPDSVRSRRDSSCSPRPRKKPSLEKEREKECEDVMVMDGCLDETSSQSSKETKLRSYLDGPRSQSPANNSSPDLSRLGRNQPSYINERHPRNSLPHNAIDPHPASLHKAHRAETLPTHLSTDGPTMISAVAVGQIIKDHLPPDLLILDVRVFAQYSKSRISGALNLNLPTTLLKRPTYDVQRLAGTFTKPQAKAKFDQWKDTKVIIVYDASSSQLKDAIACVNTLRKFTKEGWEGSTLIVKGGFASFLKHCPDMIDNESGDEGGHTKKLSIDPSKPVAGGCLMPAQQTAAMPFFSAIRQNMDLRDGVGQLPVKLPQSLNEKGISELPEWLKQASDERDRGKAVSMKFLSIEQAEQKRMQQAYSTNVSYGSSDVGASKSIQIAGIEKGTKNRYKDMLPYDHSRVRLQNIAPGDCDYVNASHIKAEWSNRHYIASQAPVPATFEDFWNVTWQQDARVFVMLTAESEGGQTKCHPYWMPGNYGSLKVQAIGESRVSLDPPKPPSNDGGTGASANSYLTSPDRAGHGRRRSTTPSNSISNQPSTAPPLVDFDAPHVILRKLLLSHEAQPSAPMREITQLQYTSWPDFGAPAHPLHVLGLVELCGEVIRGYSGGQKPGDPAPQHERPVVVHCSAGCGRTGTFCTVDSVIDTMKRQQQARKGQHAPNQMEHDSVQQGDLWLTSDVDDLIVKTVEDFRLQRLSMVQTLRQFVLCYESVLEWVSTQMPESNIKKMVGQDRRSYQG